MPWSWAGPRPLSHLPPVCLDDSFGPDCSLTCDDCRNGGACLPGLDGCDCPEGWTGLVCNESEAAVPETGEWDGGRGLRAPGPGGSPFSLLLASLGQGRPRGFIRSLTHSLVPLFIPCLPLPALCQALIWVLGGPGK